MSTKIVQLDLFMNEREQEDFKSMELNEMLVKGMKGLYARSHQHQTMAKVMFQRMMELEEIVFQMNKQIGNVSQVVFRD